MTNSLPGRIMQVFLPYPSFAHSVAVLDRARLGKQRIECGQILAALKSLRLGVKAGWQNHTSTRMWIGYEGALGAYMTLAVEEWMARGYNNTMSTPYDEERMLRDGWRDFYLPERMCDADMPPWLGREDVHASHRSRLLEKMPEHYGHLGWTEEPGRPYVWPTCE